MTCSACGRESSEHCRVHAIPCCPGKCPKPASPFDGLFTHVLHRGESVKITLPSPRDTGDAPGEIPR